jgi:hypothetical protein
MTEFSAPHNKFSHHRNHQVANDRKSRDTGASID